jgi:hypothetical protein
MFYNVLGAKVLFYILNRSLNYIVNIDKGLDNID